MRTMIPVSPMVTKVNLNPSVSLQEAHTREHAHGDARALALRNRAGHLGAQRVLQARHAHQFHHMLPQNSPEP